MGAPILGRLPGMKGDEQDQNGASASVVDLEDALQHQDMAGASRAVAVLRESRQHDDALNTLTQYAAANPAVLELLVETLDASGVVHRFAGASLLDRTAVDDVAQDSLISVVNSISSYQGSGKFSSWVHQIVQRRVVDYLRRQRETAPLHDDLAPGVRMSSMIATRATVQDALAQLPELYREPVTLRDIDGLSYAEIAERLDRSLSAVKAQISRGRAMVAGRLDESDSGAAAAE